MHIPDGYLGPATCATTYVGMVPVWATAARKVKQTLRLRQAPLLALAAAYCFVIMMFNVPIPGGSTGHAVGAVLVAVLFGPWAAVMVVSLALCVQALLFGDGGITAFGANCLTMGTVMPFCGWGIYRVLLGWRAVGERRRWLAAAIGGWLGLSAAAVVAGFLFGIQPLLAHDAAGHPLYCPFGLRIAVPAMAIEHFFVFGIVEAIATGAVVAWLQRNAPEVFEAQAERAETALHRAVPRLAAALGVLVILTPLGLIVPSVFKAGDAWGEWDSKELAEQVAKATGDEHATAPAGMVSAEEHGYKGLMPDYNLPGGDEAPLTRKSLAYILSGAIGVLMVGGALLVLRRAVTGGEPSDVRS